MSLSDTLSLPILFLLIVVCITLNGTMDRVSALERKIKGLLKDEAR